MADANIFKYPSDIDSVDSAYMIISAYPYHLKLQKNSLSSVTENISKSYAFHLVTYVPKDLKYSNAPKYEGVKALAVTAAVVDALRKTAEGGGSWATIGKETGKGVLEATTEVLKELGKGVTEGLGVDDLVQTGINQLSLASGLWPDPRLLNVYKEPSNVSQSFTFTMLANSAQEAKDIKMAILCFKYAAQPSRWLTKTKVEILGEIVPILKAPLNFDITVMVPDGTEASPNQFSNMKTYSLIREYLYMNLTNIDAKPITDTSRVDVPFYVDGNAIGYELTMSFSSMHPAIRPSDISKDDGGDIKKAIDIVNGNSSYATTGVQRDLKVRI